MSRWLYGAGAMIKPLYMTSGQQDSPTIRAHVAEFIFQSAVKQEVSHLTMGIANGATSAVITKSDRCEETSFEKLDSKSHDSKGIDLKKVILCTVTLIRKNVFSACNSDIFGTPSDYGQMLVHASAIYHESRREPESPNHVYFFSPCTRGSLNKGSRIICNIHKPVLNFFVKNVRSYWEHAGRG